MLKIKIISIFSQYQIIKCIITILWRMQNVNIYIMNMFNIWIIVIICMIIDMQLETFVKTTFWDFFERKRKTNETHKFVTITILKNVKRIIKLDAKKSQFLSFTSKSKITIFNCISLNLIDVFFIYIIIRMWKLNMFCFLYHELKRCEKSWFISRQFAYNWIYLHESTTTSKQFLKR